MKKILFNSLLVAVMLTKIPCKVFSQSESGFKTFTIQETVEKNSTIRISNTNRSLEVKTWSQNTVKIEFAVQDSLAKNMNEKNWLEKTGTKFNKFMNRLEISINGLSSGPGAGKNYSTVRPNLPGEIMREAVVSEAVTAQTRGNTNMNMGDIPAAAIAIPATIYATPVIIYIPSNNSIELINKYSDVKFMGNISKGYINVVNSVLDAVDADAIRIIAKFSTINFESVGECEADISYSTFRAGTIRKMEIESASSSVEYRTGESLYIKSNLDIGYTIDEINVVEGRIINGNIRIERLGNKIDLDGNNYDLKIRQISPETELVKINNSWANLRLPVRGLTNYTVIFDGINCAVFAPFQIVPEVKENANDNNKPGLKLDRGNVTLKNNQSPNAPRYFKASAGSASGKFTRFEITCNLCTVDFK